ncbi:MAG: hypothetical protein HZY76_18205 [Anaerolineae bacterium]|nr:MAG: hypothetical protein HZY76_18205 [Anaerolineae bacterium]
MQQISAQDLPGDLSPSTKSNRLRDLESKGLLYRVGIENVDGGVAASCTKSYVKRPVPDDGLFHLAFIIPTEFGIHYKNRR